MNQIEKYSSHSCTNGNTIEQKMAYHEIVKKLIGNINPIGETNTDNQRFENLQQLIELVENLIIDIDVLFYKTEGSPEYSIKRVHDLTKDFLTKRIRL